MGLFKRLFTISNLILAAAITLLYFTIITFKEVYFDQINLIKHAGVVAAKRMIAVAAKGEDSRPGDSLRTVKISLENDSKEYTISFQAIGVNNLVYIGDTIDLYTANLFNSSDRLHITSSGAIKSSSDSLEIMQIISKKYEKPVVDFKEYQSALRTNSWGLFFVCICFWGWYSARRFNVRSLLTFTIGKHEVEIG